LAKLLFDDVPARYDGAYGAAHDRLGRMAASLTFIMSLVKRCLPLVLLTACVSHRPRPVTIAAPVDSVPARYMAPSATYVCQSMLLYETSGPKVQSCARQGSDTTWLVDRDKDGHVLAAGWEAMVPLDELAEVTEALEDALTRQYGPPDSCVSRTGTLKQWRWWPAGRYTVQARLVDPSPLYAVRRGRLEVQAIPSEAIVCLTWVHTPADLLVP
jgi:hypothetical protein